MPQIIQPAPFIVYTPKELEAINPEGFKRAHAWFSDSEDLAFQTQEAMQSLKAFFNALDLTLTNWSIGPDAYSAFVRFHGSDGVEDMEGVRAWKYAMKRLEPGACALTGVCYDETLIDTLLKACLAGRTLREAVSDAVHDLCQELESELEYITSEAYFLENHPDYLFTESGEFFR